MKSFETLTKLLPHQKDAVNKLLPTRVGALFAEMGTGKTRIVIDLIYRRQKKIDNVVYFCPVSLKDTVLQEIKKHTDIDCVYVFDDKTTDMNIPKSFWYIIGIESMSSSSRVVMAVNSIITDNTYAVVDESTYIKGHRANRTERITKLCERARYRNILSGTPISQGVIDLFAQMKFLSPKILGYNSFYSFAANHLEYSEKYPGLIVRSHNVDYIASKIKPYTYQVTKDECLKLPRKMKTCRYFSMTLEQEKWYEKVKLDVLSEIDTQPDLDWFTSVAIFKMFLQLQQVTSGFVNRNGVKYLQHRRIDKLQEVIADIPETEKVIVFCKFQNDVDFIMSSLDNAVKFDGRDGENKRKEAVKQFKEYKKILVMTQSTGGHGFNFQDVCNYAIFYNNGFKYSERLQAEDRIHRLGQDKIPTYIDIHCISGIEERIEDALSKKGGLVSEFKKEVDKVKKEKLKEVIEKI